MNLRHKRIVAFSMAGILICALPTGAAEAKKAARPTEAIEAEADADSDEEEMATTEPTDTLGKDDPDFVMDPDIAAEIEAIEQAYQDEQEADAREDEDGDAKGKGYATKTVTITKTGFVADSFHGVDALYRKGGNDGSDATYSCAAYVKRYYKKVYGVTVMNLFAGRTPSSSAGKFKSVRKPKAGDIVACSTKSGTNHWAIVKKVNGNGTVTLIEQNWKWQQGGKTVCVVNRAIPISSAIFYRLSR